MYLPVREKHRLVFVWIHTVLAHRNVVPVVQLDVLSVDGKNVAVIYQKTFMHPKKTIGQKLLFQGRKRIGNGNILYRICVMNVQDFVLTFHITNAKRVERVNGMCAIQGNRFQQMDAHICQQCSDNFR